MSGDGAIILGEAKLVGAILPAQCLSLARIGPTETVRDLSAVGGKADISRYCRTIAIYEYTP